MAGAEGQRRLVPRIIRIPRLHRWAIPLVPIVGSPFQVDLRPDPYPQGAIVACSGVFDRITGIHLLLPIGQQINHVEE